MIRLILLLLFASRAFAATYYVSTDGGTGAGTSPATAWSIAKHNSTAIGAGNTVLFRAGDIYTTNPVLRSGVTYDIYGTGANAKFSGLVSLTSWTASGTPNIYYASLDLPEANVVIINDTMRAMGRWPKTGALYYNWNNGYNRIKSNTPIPFNAVGGEVVLNKIEQVTDRYLVEGQLNDTLSLTRDGAYHSNQFANIGWDIADKQPFFIQGALGTLTQTYDWCYQKATKRLYVYFPTAPGNYIVKAAGRENLLQIENTQNITLRHLDFEGANFTALQGYGSTQNLKLYDCNISYCGNGIRFDGTTSGVTVKRGSISNIANNGVTTFATASNWVIDSVSFVRVGHLRGAGNSSDHTQQAIYVSGDSSTVSHCSFDQVGYHAVVTHGDHRRITDNTINRPCLNKRDCGGIYEYQFTQDKTNNTPPVESVDILIARNTITNVFGPTDNFPMGKTLNDTRAIYIDAAVNHAIIENNIAISGAESAYFAIDAGGYLIIRNNYSFNWGVSGLQIYTSSRALANATVTGNTFVAGTGQYAVYYQLNPAHNLAQFGTFSGNTYNRADSDNTIRVQLGNAAPVNYKLRQFQSATGLDQTGSVSNLRPAVGADGKRLRLPSGQIIQVSQ